MIEMMNKVVGITIILFFIIGVFCNIVVKRKYKKMFATMRNKGRDKNLLIIERDYRHGYLQERVERIKVFVEKEYYEIKIANIPLYYFEDFTITSVYFIVLIGLIFTLLIISLSNGQMQGGMIEIFFLCIEGLIMGTILMTIRIFLGLNDIREIFKVNLCNYLENELELFGGVEKQDEISEKAQQNCENNTNFEKSKKDNDVGSELYKCDNNYIPDNTKVENKSIMKVIDEHMLEEVLEEILG